MPIRKNTTISPPSHTILPQVTVYGFDKSKDSNKRILSKMLSIPHSNNFALVDKYENLIHIFTADGKFLRSEPVITGKNNSGKHSYHEGMPAFLQRGLDIDLDGNISPNDYFSFLDKNNLKITPEGLFSISKYKEGYSTPDIGVGKELMMLGSDFINNVPLGTRKAKVLASRKDSYGDGRIFLLKDQRGIPQSIAYHSTGNTLKLRNYYSSNPRDRDLSSGCLNFNSASLAPELLKENSKIFIYNNPSPIEIESIANTPTKVNRHTDNLRKRIFTDAILQGISTDPGFINYATATSLKESKGGSSALSKLQTFLTPILPWDNSYGEFEMKDSFRKKYGKANNPNISDLGVLFNFYRDKTGLAIPSPTRAANRIYSEYNTGKPGYRTGPAIKEFKKKYSRLYDNYK